MFKRTKKQNAEEKKNMFLFYGEQAYPDNACLGIAPKHQTFSCTDSGECPDCFDERGIYNECKECEQVREQAREDLLRSYKLKKQWRNMYKKSSAEWLLKYDLDGRDHFLKYHEEWLRDDDIPF